MQFIPNGPDIPNELLHAHEEGRVLFFCGAGISYPADLPGFSELVIRMSKHAGEPLDKSEQDMVKQGGLDRAIGHFEKRIQGGRAAVRRGLPSCLTADLSKPRALTTHLALLTLGKDKKDNLKLVTTNFDTLFEKAGKSPITIHQAPPSRSRWSGIVHLHGRMPDHPSEEDLDQLILSDGDFGQAYLTEGWAARFVAGLFRDYTLCFVGYSIDDPVLRYMTAAHALDGKQQVFAFASYKDGELESTKQKWQEKHVVPIMYNDAKDHHNLHQTLHEWASIYSDGVMGKEQIVARYADQQPNDSSPQNDFAGRMRWALSDPSGLPAKRFAEFTPAPSLAWLPALAEPCFGHADLSRFGGQATPHQMTNHIAPFSLLSRPAPYQLAAKMQLACSHHDQGQWDKLMFQLASWLVRYLDDPDLLLWIIEQGGPLHGTWQQQIEWQLDYLARLDREGSKSALALIRKDSPKAIPRPMMRTLWQLLLAGRLTSSSVSPVVERTLTHWIDQLTFEPPTATQRLRLRQLLAPTLMVRQPPTFMDQREHADMPKRLKRFLNSELALATEQVSSLLHHVANERWVAALPQLLDEFQGLLQDALDLLHEIGEADEYYARSEFALPSIAAHPQNHGLYEWATLIELLRDAWLGVLTADSLRAAGIAQAWFAMPYPVFKRLALFAASHEGTIVPTVWVGWLLADNGRWLWSEELRREVCRLLAKQGVRLADYADAQARLESAILAGPADLSTQPNGPDNESEARWLRLAKLHHAGLVLGLAAQARLNELAAQHPTWRCADNQYEEFPHWLNNVPVSDRLYGRHSEQAPNRRRQLMSWLQQPTSKHDAYQSHGDNWRELCRQRFSLSFCALLALAREGQWPTERWSQALASWHERAMATRSWRYVARLIRQMPDDVVKEIIEALSHWIFFVVKATKKSRPHEAILLTLCARIIRLGPQSSQVKEFSPDVGEHDDALSEAIDEPIGRITECVYHVWLRRQPADDGLLPSDIRSLFTEICESTSGPFRHGRVILGAYLATLFHIDRSWTEHWLLPLFDWERSPEAGALWQGFLHSPRLHPSLLIAIKAPFLAGATHYYKLGACRLQYAACLTDVALDRPEGYQEAEMRAAIAQLPPEELHLVAQKLYLAIDSAGEQREIYWQRYGLPFWQHIWPKDKTGATPEVALELSRMAIAAGGEFTAVLAKVQDWLLPLHSPDRVVSALYHSGLCQQQPESALRLLVKVIAPGQRWLPHHLDACLQAIVTANRELTTDRGYQELQAYQRMAHA
ncbi:anti-phage defense-associated sirtuin Dsr1 [Aeromonas sp. HMWF017]|uniref:anti-phage defense-associated sirtuin Dsr1 n=3 Tax=unclassified Aeromonas TaxID=257493 RepID=UPI0015E820FA|nr:anti-phage defense-associated sirtuin Dsr1 [Aeromonas sp. HMWF017]